SARLTAGPVPARWANGMLEVEHGENIGVRHDAQRMSQEILFLRVASGFLKASKIVNRAEFQKNVYDAYEAAYPHTRCPDCGTGMSVSRKLIDTTIKCPRCKKPFLASECD